MFLQNYAMSLFILDNLSCSEACSVDANVAMTALFGLALAGRCSSQCFLEKQTQEQVPISMDTYI